ncbi:hypothetical protein N657DRAFT_635302 [Parathielavia appendiculata]|uniref:MARVEL domain-containing protein n=1 Tax=Parathielavia appendiculata TaxID=2587402 RepID=A0AAN6TW33_9PEZI|nr:hypothetical protein N657DRAFT_635302 [Parathielavia appendiculata]
MGMRGLTAVGVPPQPHWLLYIKVAVLVLAVIVIALAAWAMSLYNGGYPGGFAGGMDHFIAILSFAVYGSAIGLEFAAPRFFYRIVYLVGYGLTVIFWLAAWAWSASSASAWISWSAQIGGALAGCAALGAVAWILTMVHLARFIRACTADTVSSGQAPSGA